MLKRTITGVIMIGVAIPIMIFSDTWALPAVAAILSLIATYEVFNCIGVAHKYRIAIPVYVYAGVLPLITRLLYLYSAQNYIFEYAALLAIGLVIYLFAIMMFSKGKIVYREIAEIYMTVLYISAGFCAMIYLNDHGNRGSGKFALIMVFLAAFSTDIFAYICGRLFGKHKLIPEVSPKKTIEGSIGGIVFCDLFLLGYGFLLQHFLQIQVDFVVLLISGIFISIISQIGDLIMSSIKRTYEIKDFGKIFPGHGGVLDRFDSAIAVATILLPIETLFGIFHIA